MFGIIPFRGAADALDLLYPRACVHCGDSVTESFRYICWNCATLIQYLQAPMCSQCGEPVEGRVDGEFVCQLCSSSTRWFDRARSAARHDEVVRNLIHTFKYREGTWMLRDLAVILNGCYATHFAGRTPDLVVPVPLHPARRRMRGYNQAGYLARALARGQQVPCSSRLLQRIRMTSSQTELKAGDRARNVRGAFRVNPSLDVKGSNVLLIDDVMTTGATVSECARVLDKAGAARVDVATLARG
jgi:ComF family protein